MWHKVILPLKVVGALVLGLLTARLNASDITDVLLPFGINTSWSLITFFLFFVFVGLWIFGLEGYKRHLENSKPNIIWSENHGAALHPRGDDGRVKNDEYLCHVLQLWFENKPKIATESSVAKNVKASLVFYNRNDKSVMPSVPGCFVATESLNYMGNTGERWEIVTEWSAYLPQKLQIATKRQEQQSAYVFGKVDVGAELPKGDYYLKIDVMGTGIINLKPFWFALSNLGTGYELTLSKQIKKPNLRKEGFQT